VARQAIQAAVTLGESVGYVRLLVDQGAALVPLLVQLRATPYRNQLLAALGQAPPTPTTQPVPSHVAANQGLSEPLSARELEVLRLVVADASNQEIAEQLVITLGTVKNHMTNILGKLGVRNRWAAIRKTKELGLL
jgi:LuxR family maltose regulon positive regulatory protein